VLQQPLVPAVIVGARNAEHVADHRALFTFALDGDDLDAIGALLERAKRPKGDCYTWERGGEF
jgi:aryl-alcohol dehydrogenase-like predicted oxidoreductase